MIFKMNPLHKEFFSSKFEVESKISSFRVLTRKKYFQWTLLILQSKFFGNTRPIIIGHVGIAKVL